MCSSDLTETTAEELAARFEKEHIDLRLKPSTAKGYKRMLERFVLPRLGNLRVTEVTRADIAQLHHDLRHIAYDANRCLEMISKMFNLAEMWGLRPDGSNPRKHIKRYPEQKRERFLSQAELKRVGEVLREMEQEGIELPSSIAAVRLLMLTGCRLGEIMNLKWEHVDIPAKALRLPDSKTGAKVVHLGRPAIDVLERIERVEDNPWVIVGTLPGGRLSDLQPFWQRVRARAGLKDVRIHDLRHTFASAAVLLRPYQPEGVLGMVEELAAEREKKAASSIRNSITWPNSQPKLGSSRRVITSSGE